MVNFFNITTGKLIQYQVVKKFIDIHKEVVKQADYAMYQEKRACQDKVYRHLTADLIEKNYKYR